MGSGPLAQPLFYQYKSTSEPVRLCCSNASQGMTASGLARAKGELLATILRLLDVSAVQPRAPKPGLLPIKLVPFMRQATAAAGAPLRYSFTPMAPPRRAAAATDAGHGAAVAR